MWQGFQAPGRILRPKGRGISLFYKQTQGMVLLFLYSLSSLRSTFEILPFCCLKSQIAFYTLPLLVFFTL